MTDRLTEEMWDAARPVFEEILEHPFITELTSGDLDHRRFVHYLVQDIQYIDAFTRILSAVASRAPAREDVAVLGRRAGELAAEHELHEGLSVDLGVSPERVASTRMAPTNVAYVNYLQATAHTGSFLEALAAMLACPWIYWEVGKVLIERGSPDPLYRRWIERYGGEVAAVNVPPLLRVADRVGDEASEAERRRAVDRFVVGCRYEWMFWDMGYREEEWPV